MDIITIFIMLQVILLFCMTFHDWVHLPPLTNIREMERHSTKRGRFINSALFFLLVFTPLFLTWCYQPAFPLWVLLVINGVYGLLSVGTIFSWWIPYFFGSYTQEFKQAFEEYKNTHHFLPARGDNTVPNTMHVLLHLQIWICFGIAIYLLMYR